MDLSVEINRKGKTSWQKILSKLILTYERNAYVMKHYFNVLLGKSFYLLYKNYKEKSHLNQNNKSRSRNNDIDECSRDVRRNLNFSSKQMNDSAISVPQESLKSFESRVSKLVIEPDRLAPNQRAIQHREIPKFLQTEGNQSDTYYKSHILDNPQPSDTRMSVKSKQNLSVAQQNVGLNSNMLDSSFNGIFLQV